jgi:hypothetical protein
MSDSVAACFSQPPAHKLADMDKEVDVQRQVGLYKVQGEAVEAILGGIY